jgi:adenylate cyclase
VDSDGIVRRVPILYGYKEALYESLSLATARLALGDPEIELGVVEKGDYRSLEFLRLGDRTIYVDDYIRAFIPYRGQYPSFPYVSASDILTGQVEDPNILKNKIVLIGTTAQGLLDLRPTPIASTFPGVEIHANMIAGILDSKTMRNPEYIATVEILLLIFIGLVMIVILPLLGPFLATLGTLLMFGLVFWINVKLWNDMHLVLPLAPTFLLMFSLLLINMSYGFFVEAGKKRQLTGLFGQYVPPELVDEMGQQLGRAFTMEGQSREMTVFFSDVRGFTTISEGLESKELAELMNAYLTPMTEIIHQNRGTIDKYMGDAIMAFWGAPLDDPDHAHRGVFASMQMIKRLAEIQPQFQKRGWPPIKIGIGLNTGVMNVGNMGSKFRMAYTVMGDAVNLGSRLEGLTKQYGVQIIVSERTKIAVADYLFRELDQVRVKGKEKPVAIFEPLGQKDQIDDTVKAELQCHQQALIDYRAQRWEEAEKAFIALHEEQPERLLYDIYLQRIAHFKNEPPPKNWDGVFTFTVK